MVVRDAYCVSQAVYRGERQRNSCGGDASGLVMVNAYWKQRFIKRAAILSAGIRRVTMGGRRCDLCACTRSGRFTGFLCERRANGKG